jgi:O-antigen ligase
MKVIQQISYTLIALIIITPLSVWGQYMSFVYYALLILLSVFIILQNLIFEDLKFDSKSLLFLIVCLCSLIFNNVDARYNSWWRLGCFCMLMFVLGPLNKTDFSTKIRCNIMNSMKKIIVILTILSLIAYILGLSFAFRRGVSGLFNHSMVLSPMAAISSLVCLDGIGQKNKIKKIFLIVLFCCSLFMCLVAASRGAIGALLVGCLTYQFFKYKGKIKKVLWGIITLSALFTLVFIYNPWQVLDKFLMKMDRNTEEMLSGRGLMWMDRLEDFKSSPVIGIGFNSAKNSFYSKIEYDSLGNVSSMETGSGWLAVLGQTGLLGIIIYLLLLFTPVVKAWKSRNIKVSLNVAIVVFFSIHTIIEGYSIASGNSLCAIMWLNLGFLTAFSTPIQSRESKLSYI